MRINVFSWKDDPDGRSVKVRAFTDLDEAEKYLNKQKGQRIIAVGDKEIQRAFEIVGGEKSDAERIPDS